MVTCEKCDNVNSDGAKFCNGCGAALVQEQQQQGPQPSPMCACGRGPLMPGKTVCASCWAESKTGM